MRRHAAGAKLKSYPEGVVHAPKTPKIFAISLGRYDGCLGFNSLVVNGRVCRLRCVRCLRCSSSTRRNATAERSTF